MHALFLLISLLRALHHWLSLVTAKQDEPVLLKTALPTDCCFCRVILDGHLQVGKGKGEGEFV